MGSITRLNSGYLLKTVSAEDILEEMKFTSDVDSFLTGEIIQQLESDIADTVKDNKAIAIPYIGTLRKNLAKKEFRTKYGLIKDARSAMNLQDFKLYVKELYAECTRKVYMQDNLVRKENKFKSRHKKLYENKFKLHGLVYANTWVHCMCLIEVVPYDDEIEEMFKLIINET